MRREFLQHACREYSVRVKTRAEGLDLPPATIERQQELLALSLPEDATKDPGIRRELEAAQRAVDAHADHMRHPENRRRFALQVLRQLDGATTGNKDNHFFADRFVLVPDKSGLSWSWSMTPHYAMISKIPADVDYVVRAYSASERIVEKWTMPVDRFLDQAFARLEDGPALQRRRERLDCGCCTPVQGGCSG